MCDARFSAPSRMERMIQMISSSRWGRLAFVLGLVLTAVAPAGATNDRLQNLKERITHDYDVLVVRSGLVLTPKDEDVDYRNLEIVGDEIWIDGARATADRLEEALGGDLGPVRRLADLSVEEQRELFGGPTGAVHVPAPPTPPAMADAPVPPMAPMTPEAPAAPSIERRRRSRDRDSGPKVTVGGSVHVPAGEIAEDAVAVGGVVLVDGEVTGEAVAVGGTVTINGRVNGDATAVGASVILGPDAEVLGDVTSVGGKVVKPATARIDGEVHEVSSLFSLDGLKLGPIFRQGHTSIDLDDDDDDTFFRRTGSFIARVLRTAFYGLLVWLAILLLPRPLDRMRTAVANDPWRQGLIGLVTQILFLPVMFLAVVVLAVSIIGIPLLILVPVVFLLAVIGALLGFAAVAEQVGTWARDRFGWRFDNRYTLALIGVVAIYAVSFFAKLVGVVGGPIRFVAFLFGLVGLCLVYAAWTVGFGAAVSTRLGTQDRWQPLAARRARRAAAAGSAFAAGMDSPPPAPPTSTALSVSDAAPATPKPTTPADDDEPKDGSS
jgi:hypothetical protein